jgi:O-antigen ligase
MIDVVLPIALTQFLAEKNWLKRLGLVTCLGIMLAGLMTTKVRASLAAVVIVTLAVLTVGYLRQWISWKRMTLVIMAGLLLLIATAPLMVERFRTGAYGEDRMPLIYTALNMIKGNPMLGVGASNYAFRIDDYRPPEVAAAWVYVVHNEFLLRLAETGLIGFLLYYSLVGLAMIGLWRLTRTSDPWIFILSCGLLAAFVGSLPHRMLTTYYFESMFRMFCTLLALAFAMQRFERKQRAAE